MGGLLSTICCLLLATAAAAASFRAPTASPCLAALGGMQACGAEGLDPLSGNPADLAGGAGFFLQTFATRFYGLEELGYGELAARAGLGQVGGAVRFSSFGFELYREQVLQGALAAPLGGRVSLGLGLAWLSRRIGDHPTDDALDMTIGLAVRIHEDFSLGAVLRHATAPRLSAMANDRLEREALFGLHWRVSPELSTQCSIRLPGADAAVLAGGVAYRPFPFLALRIGANSLDHTLACGAGFTVGAFQIDYALTESRSGLGTTHLVALGYRFGGNPRAPAVGPAALPERVDINSAPAETLARLPGISHYAAGAIVRERILRGPFTHIRELGRLKVVKPAELIGLDGVLAVSAAGEVALRLPGENHPAVTLNGMEMRDLIGLGIPPLAARTLILYRNSRGGFRSLAELSQVPGFDRENAAKLQEALRGDE